MYDFKSMLDFSVGQQQKTDVETIRRMITGCVRVEKSGVEMDVNGIDYIATLRGGAEIFIDAKNRNKGCSRFWTNGPEVALEKWSAMPDENTKGAVGWSLCETKNVDYILFTFDPEDCEYVYLFGFQLLRVAFRKYCAEWFELYSHAIQTSHAEQRIWQSECVFVPVYTVYDAVREVSQAPLIPVAQTRECP